MELEGIHQNLLKMQTRTILFICRNFKCVSSLVVNMFVVIHLALMSVVTGWNISHDNRYDVMKAWLDMYITDHKNKACNIL